MMIYVASPYTHENSNIEYERYLIARNYTARLLNARQSAFSPIVYGYYFHTQENTPGTAPYWWPLNRAMIEVCSSFHVLIINGWVESAGVTHEIAYAKELGRRIQYVSP